MTEDVKKFFGPPALEILAEFVVLINGAHRSH
jgi:hypothetical protein